MGHIFISFLFFNIILLILYRHYKRGDYFIKKSDLVFYTILFIAFATYGGGEGDYLHLMKRMSLFETIDDVYYYDMMEVQYNYLAYFVKGNYFLWRLVVFSVQFVGMSWLLYKAKLNTYPVFLSFVAICLYTSIYGRAYWGMIYYFLGLYLMLERKNPLWLIVIALCYFSHTQNIVLLALLPLSFIELKKWHLLVVLVVFGSLIGLFQEAFTDLINSGGIEGADYLNEKIQIYGQKGGLGFFGGSIGEVTIFMLRYIPVVSFVLYLIFNIIFSRKNNIYKPYRGFFNVIVGILIISLIVLFANMSSGALFYRILAMIFFPTALLLPYLRQAGILKKATFNNFITIYIIATELAYVKDLYYSYVGGNV